MLEPYFTKGIVEAGCDEAGRGCLAGPVFAAAVILPQNYNNELLDDSKKLTAAQRYSLRLEIEAEALAWAIGQASHKEIDQINILNASYLAMHRALAQLEKIEHILVDGNRFKTYEDIPYHCIVKGDGLYFSIAAASVLAKTYRDDFMLKIHEEHPEYAWNKNKGYPTRAHREAIKEYGITPYHRKSFNLLDSQMRLTL